MAQETTGIKINGNGPFASQIDSPFNNPRSLYHITNGNYPSYEPARSTDFELYVYGLSDLLGMDETEAQEVIRIAVAKAPIPHFTIQPLEQRRGNTVQKFAGTPSFEAGTMELYDWIGVNTKSILMKWQEKASNLRTGKTGVLSEYKKRATLCEYSPDGQKIRSWTMYGCWISAISEEPFDHGNQQSERRITATLQYDLALPDEDDIG